jgi:hypothetical protein
VWIISWEDDDEKDAEDEPGSKPAEPAKK